MSRGSSKKRSKHAAPSRAGKKTVKSLLDAMEDEREYASLVDITPGSPLNLRDEIQKAIAGVETIRQRGEKLLKAGQSPAWTDIQILRSIDPKELGNVLTLSEYSILLATTYLESYKFRDWTVHSDGTFVTPDERRKRAREAATTLCSHDVWETHSHGISREVAKQELRIKIDRPERISELDRAIRRLWALFYWAFENTPIFKVFISSNYALFRIQRGGSR